MKNSKVISFQEHKICKNYYNIGLVIGALRAELENGTVGIEDVYNLLTTDIKSAIGKEISCNGGAR
jgi:hypothetical protein